MEGKILARHRKMLSVALQQNNFTLDLWWKDACSPSEYRNHLSLLSLFSPFFLVKQLDRGNRFTNWIRSLVEITSYLSLSRAQIYPSEARGEFLSKFFDKRFSSYHFTTHSRGKAKRPSHFSRFEIVFPASLLKTVARNLDRVTSANSLFRCWPLERRLPRLYALCKCKCQCHQSEIRLTRSVKVNEAWWEPRFVRSVYDSW